VSAAEVTPLPQNLDIDSGSLKNFQDYLQYKEHSTENLLFWNWYKRYRLRFQNLEENERALSGAPTRSAQVPDLTQVPNLKIKNGDEIAGGDFMRSSTLTTVCLELTCADVCRRIFRR
jgi:hypothetical protein